MFFFWAFGFLGAQIENFNCKKETKYTQETLIIITSVGLVFVFIKDHSGIYNEDVTFFIPVGLGYLTTFLFLVSFGSLSRENWWLLTDKPVEFEK